MDNEILAGECARKIVRIRISVDIKKPLIKILELKQEEDGMEKILVFVRYERFEILTRQHKMEIELSF